MSRIKHWLWPLVVGILGMLLVLAVRGAWQFYWRAEYDHQRLNVIDQQVGIWQRQAIEQQKAGGS